MKKDDRVLVVGGGIDSIQASIDLANSGFKVFLVEKNHLLRINLDKPDKSVSVIDCSSCPIPLKFMNIDEGLQIELIRNAEIISLEGKPGDFIATIYKRTEDPQIKEEVESLECINQCLFKGYLEEKESFIDWNLVSSQFSQIAPLKILKERRKIPPCENACPAHVRCQDYVDLIFKGKYQESLNVIRERCPLPSVIGRVCPHPCEDACNRGDIEESINICVLKRFVADYVKENLNEKIEFLEEKKEKKVAIVGSGPSGLTVAYNLARRGYSVTIFEKSPVAGGMLRVGIPDYRLPPDILNADIDHIKRYGVELKTNSSIGPPGPSIKDLRNEYDAVFIGIGLQNARKLNIEGEDLENVIYGIDFLRKCALGEEVTVGKNVLVIGGGDVAVDAARSALRKGAEKVQMAMLESEDIIPANSWEVIEAREEGIIFHTSRGPNKFIGNEGKVIGLETLICSSVFDEEGRFNPVFEACSEEIIDADMVIVTIGQAADLTFLDKEIKVGRGIDIDQKNFQTSMEGVFAGGEVVTGPGSAINAMATGNKAAIVIDSYLKGKDITNIETIPDYEDDNIVTIEDLEKLERVEKILRKNPNHISPNERKTNFKEFTMGFDEETAVAEADRCLSCGICCECTENVKKCVGNVIEHDQFDETISINIQEVILTPGEWLSCYDLRKLTDYRWEIINPIARVNTALCIGCNRCADVCSYEAVGVMFDKGFMISQVDPNLCKGCGDCVVECPAEAIILSRFGRDRIESVLLNETLTKKGDLHPKIVAFLCSWCSYGGEDLARVSQDQSSLDLRAIRVMCSASVDISYIFQAFLNGADGVIIGGCHIGRCHHVAGNIDTLRRTEQIKKGLIEIGINPERFKLEWFAPSEDKIFTQTMKDFINKIKELGPIENEFKLKKNSPEKASVIN